MMKSFLFVVLMLVTPVLFAEDITILVDGVKKQTLSMDEIRKMKSETIEFFEHVTNSTELYVGVPTSYLFKKVYPEYEQASEVELISSTEYKYLEPMSRIIENMSIMAYDRADNQKFVRFSKTQKMLVPLGPLYHVWNMAGKKNGERLEMRTTYQIIAINFITKHAIALKEGLEDKELTMGLANYKQHCISCHAIGKYGGEIGVDLVKRKVLEKKGGPYILKYILTPNAVNPKTKMLPLPAFKDREEKAKAIVTFLEFMENPNEYFKKNAVRKDSSTFQELKKLMEEIKK